MAQAPRRESRSIAGLADPASFSPSARLQPLRQGTGLRPTVTIGGQTYREVDNGRANVLVPVEDPLFSAAELAERQRAIVRSLFMADHPLGAGAYGLVALLGGSPRVQDRALMAGALADTVIGGAAAPRFASVRAPTPPRQGQRASAGWPQPAIQSRDLNVKSQAMGVTATLTAPMLRTGTRADRRLRPPGWQGHGTKFNEGRGHLLGSQLGGLGSDARNLVTLTQNPTNHPHMRGFEDEVARRVRAGEVVEFSSTPFYGADALRPEGILLTAHGSRGAPSARFIFNPPRPR